MKIKIYRTSWERYDDEGCCDVFYSSWRINKEDAISDHKEILELAKQSKVLVSVNNMECEEILCRKEDLEKLLEYGN